MCSASRQAENTDRIKYFNNQCLIESNDESVSYSGLPRPLITELCRQGHVYAVKRGRWYVSRKSLEQLGDVGTTKPPLLLPEPDKIGRGEFDGVNGVTH